jgi:thiamine biosynthesis lipoprotein
MESAFEVMQELVRVFDRFDPASHVSHLNATGVLRDVPPALARVLRAAQRIHASSNRVFDVTILPLLELTERSLQTTGHPPEHKAVQELLGSIGLDRVHIGDHVIRFDRAETRITLDGIAKGYIVDQAANVLKRHSIDAAMINAGGDIRVLGSKQGRPWHIGIQDPSGQNTHVQTLALQDMAVATSGSYENYFDPLMRHHHLLDANGAGSPRRVVSATAVAPSAMMADSLSTTFFLLPPQQAVSLASSLNSVEASIITLGGRHFTSDSWSSIRA